MQGIAATLSARVKKLQEELNSVSKDVDMTQSGLAVVEAKFNKIGAKFVRDSNLMKEFEHRLVSGGNSDLSPIDLYSDLDKAMQKFGRDNARRIQRSAMDIHNFKYSVTLLPGEIESSIARACSSSKVKMNEPLHFSSNPDASTFDSANQQTLELCTKERYLKPVSEGVLRLATGAETAVANCRSSNAMGLPCLESMAANVRSFDMLLPAQA